MKNKTVILLIVITLLASFFRLYKLGSIPPAMDWDEAAIGYDAYSILNGGKDQWGVTFPAIFKSFGEYKYPLDIYATSLFYIFFGMSDFSSRLPYALFGIADVVLLFCLVKLITKNNFLSLSSAFFLTISPMSIQFSRQMWAINFTLFFFFLALIFFILYAHYIKCY